MILLNEDLLKIYGADRWCTQVTPSPVKAGDVIIAARPFVHALATSVRGKRCEGCLSMTSPLKVICSCNYAHYCSEACKESDWALHRDLLHPFH